MRFAPHFGGIHGSMLKQRTILVIDGSDFELPFVYHRVLGIMWCAPNGIEFRLCGPRTLAQLQDARVSRNMPRRVSKAFLSSSQVPLEREEDRKVMRGWGRHA